MRVRFSQRACFTGILFVFAGVIFYFTFGLGRVARLVPFAIVVPTLLLLLFQFLMDLLPRLAEGYSKLENKDLFGVEGLRGKVRKPSDVGRVEAAEGKKEGRAFLALLLLPLLICLLGFLLTLPVYTLVYLKKQSEKWFIAIPVALMIGGLVYSLFVLDLGAPLYEGILWRWLAK